ncbi:MAG: PAS domain S-box protein [Candidatus Bathyarchaeia archaeon]|jgi:PAS domain S-box-containing protein
MGSMSSAADSCSRTGSDSEPLMITILHVDDSADFLATTKQILELENPFHIENALTVNDALHKLRQKKFDVIVSDYQLAGNDGLTFLSELRESGDTTPFILFTGKSREEVAIKALNLGADFFINKIGHPEIVFSQLSHYVNQAVEKRRAEERLRYKLEFESVVARISSRFVNPADLDLAIVDSLKEMGQISGVSRVYIFLFQENGELMDNTHEWCLDGVCPQIDNLKNLPCASIPWWMRQLNRGKIIQITDLSLMPPEAVAEKVILEQQDVKSVLVLPIHVSGKLAGFIGFDDVYTTGAWSSDEVALLQIVSELIGNSLERETTEMKLKESERKYRLLTENTTDVIFIQGLDLSIKYVSPSVEALTGYLPEEILKLMPHEFIAPESYERALATWKEAMLYADKQPENEIRLLQYEYVRKDGSTFWGELKVKFLRDSNGQLLGTQGTLRDITERKNMEEQLKDSEKKYRLLTENITDAMFIQDMNLNVIYVNRSIETLAGYTPEEIYCIRPENFMTPESFKHGVTDFQNAISLAKQGLESEIPLAQYEYIRKDGSTFWGELKTSFLRDSTGRLVGLQGILRDISERKLIEEKLKESERKYRLLTENISDVVFIQNLDLSIKYVSPSVETLSGYTPEEIIKLGPKGFMTEESFERGTLEFKEAIALAAKNPEFDFPFWCYEYIRKDGSSVWGEFKAKLLRDSNGNIVGIQGTLRDVNERKKNKESLDKIVKELTVINEKLNVISKLTRHDARNKLSVIANNVYLIKRRLTGNNEALDYLSDIESAIDQIDRIFSFAKNYELLGATELSPVKVKNCIEDACMLFSDLDGLTLVNNCSGLTVMADSLLWQLFYNLIDNSLRHGETVKQIRIHYEETEDFLKLIYDDDGVGVPDFEKEKIFLERYGKGTGYGLYLMRKMCETYGWTVKETGTHQKGAQFTITIPKMEQPINQ